MGNKLSIKLHKWSSAYFPEENALIHISDNTKHSIFLWKVSQESVVLRLGESMCHHHPTRSLHMEVSAQRDNMNCFNFEKVRVVVDGTYQQNQSKESLRDLCGRESCFYEVVRKVGKSGSVKKVYWEFFHSYKVSGSTHIRYHVIIECDKEKGLRADIRGPFKCQGNILSRSLLPEGEKIQEIIINEDPRKELTAFAASGFQGQEYILFKVASHKQIVNIVNTGGNFQGNGTASVYKNCKIYMETNFGRK